MIIDVEKFVFIGVKNDLDLFFERAQEQGLVEFIPKTFKKSEDLPKTAQDLLTAIKILRKETPDPDKNFGEEVSPNKLAQRVIFLRNSIEKHHEEARLLAQEKAKVEPFGHFSLLDLRKFEREIGRHFQFFQIKKTKVIEKLPKELIPIGSDFVFRYFISLEFEKKHFPSFTEMHLERSLTELENRTKRIKDELRLYQEELKSSAGYIDFLKEFLIEEMNSHHLDFAKAEVNSYFEDLLFSTEAWIPKKDVKKMEPLLKDLKIHIERVSIQKDDRVPTCMRNKGLHKLGEDLVKIYDIPDPKDKDPSGFVVGFFAIFFSMIVADAGYGAIYFFGSLFGYLRLGKKSESVNRMMRLFLLISSCCIIWGMCIGSYFGLQLKPSNPLQKASVLQTLVMKKAKYHMSTKDDVYEEWLKKDPKIATVTTPREFVLAVEKKQGGSISYEILDEFNDNVLIEVALLMGVIHVIISLFRYLRREWSSIGWVLFILGGYFYFPSMLDNATSIFHFLGIIPKKAGAEVGLQLLYVGIGLALVLAIIQHKKKGIEEPLKCIQVFADILSYLRLYALALAGMIMASTFNQIGKDVGFALGFFIIIIGHVTNMTLGIMGGVIHGLRLNFLEWYHYSFDGGGKLFNPLKKLQ
ncbi:MAG: hypothetical protein S4CHLAM37_03730 [Chlamydiia bacterium]|nr:hypothetical protein [Chlamydiia bacterium]